MKKIFLLCLVLFPNFSFAYTPLANIDAFGNIGKPLVTGGGVLSTLFNQAFYAMLAVAIALAIFMIIRGGYSYIMSADSGDAKTSAKNKIQAAFGGLLLALGAVVILQFINPEILKVEFVFPGLEKPQTKVDPDLTSSKSRKTIQTMISDGFQKGDGTSLAKDTNLLAFFGELNDQQLIDLLKNQLLDEPANAPEGYRGFLDDLYNQKLSYEESLYYIDTRTGQKVLNRLENRTYQISAINNILNRFESINNKLLPLDQHVFQDAKAEYIKNKNAPKPGEVRLRY
jgi:hypothetical protein